MITIKTTEIRSAKQALKMSKQLDSIWSRESLLTQRVLIYIAELLENRKPTIKAKRKLSKWQQHVTKELRAGKSIKQAAESYRATK